MEKARREFPHLRQIETGTRTTVIILTIHVQDLFARDREQTRKHAFGEAGALYGVNKEVLWASSFRDGKSNISLMSRQGLTSTMTSYSSSIVSILQELFLGI